MYTRKHRSPKLQMKDADEVTCRFNSWYAYIRRTARDSRPPQLCPAPSQPQPQQCHAGLLCQPLPTHHEAGHETGFAHAKLAD